MRYKLPKKPVPRAQHNKNISEGVKRYHTRKKQMSTRIEGLELAITMFVEFDDKQEWLDEHAHYTKNGMGDGVIHCVTHWSDDERLIELFLAQFTLQDILSLSKFFGTEQFNFNEGYLTIQNPDIEKLQRHISLARL